MSENVELVCSWKGENERCLRDTLTETIYDGTESELDSIVNYETCVHLLEQNKTQCELKFKCLSPKDTIAEIAIVSEAKIMELYGFHGEYILTSQAEFIDEFEDMSVYMAVLKLPESAKECLVKLLRPKTKDQMWVYGINVSLEQRSRKGPDTSINFENVNKILKESSHQLTDKADKCKRFLQSYGSMLDANKITSKPPDPQVLMKMLESAYLPQGHLLGDQARVMSRCLTDLLPDFSSKAKTDVGKTEFICKSCIEAQPKQDISSANWEHHTDIRFLELESKLMKRVDERLNEMETRLDEKLDLILARLGNLQPSIQQIQ